MAQTLDDLWNMAVLSMIYGYLTRESMEFHVFFWTLQGTLLGTTGHFMGLFGDLREFSMG